MVDTVCLLCSPVNSPWATDSSLWDTANNLWDTVNHLWDTVNSLWDTHPSSPVSTILRVTPTASPPSDYELKNRIIRVFSVCINQS